MRGSSSCLDAIHGDIAVGIGERSRLFEPLVNPLAAHLRAHVRQIRAEHLRPIDVLKAMAAGAIQVGEQLAAAIQLRRLRQLIAMAGAARALNEMNRQNGLFPGERRFVGLRHFGCRPWPR